MTASVKHWTIGILLLYFISIDLLIGGTFGAESSKVKAPSTAVQDKKGAGGGGKVKCKEHIEEALRKYWDDEKGEYVTAKLSDEIESQELHKKTQHKHPVPSKPEVKGKAPVKVVTTTPPPVRKVVTTTTPAPVSEEDDDTEEDVTEEETEEDVTDEDGIDTEEEEDEDDDDETEEDATEEDEDEEDDDETEEDTEEDVTEEDVSEEPVTKPPPQTPQKLKTTVTPMRTTAAPVKTTTTTTTTTTSAPTTEKPRVGRLPVQAKTTPAPTTTTTTPAPATEKPRVGRLPVTPKPAVTTTTTTTTPAPAKPAEKPRIGRLPVTTTTTTTPAPQRSNRAVKAEPKFVIEEIDSSEEEDESDEEFKSRSQVEEILKLDEIGTDADVAHETLIMSTFKELKKIYENAIKPLETTYKYKYISNRLISDAEIFSKPMVLFLGAKSSGKTSLVNYLLGLESTPWQLRTGVSTAPQHFTILEYGDNFSKLSPMEISADFAFSNLQQFGQHFVENHLEAYRMPLSILQRVTIVDSPGLIDGILAKAPEPGKSIDSEVYQWFVDRADIIFIVVESTQVQMTQAMKDLLEQLKGRDVRFIISKAEVISQTQCVMLIGQLLWSLSPVMPSDKPPQVYALTTSPVEEYNPFLDLQEEEWLKDLANLISGVSRVESRASAIRRHAVRVRNHAKVIDCYLSAYYKRKPLFTFGQAAKKLSQDITENPHNYNIFKGALASVTQNVSRYDLPDPDVYREFFRANHLLDFKQLSQTCSFFSGCAIDKLDAAIAYRIPKLVENYKKQTDKSKGKTTGTKGSPNTAKSTATTSTTTAAQSKKKA